jgi:polyhydroxybutyrate depolymerase
MVRTIGCRGLLLVLLVVMVVSVSGVTAQGGGEGRLEMGDLVRTYTVMVPSSYDGTEPVPLVIALHPFASSGKAMAALTGLDAMAEARGFIVAYPDSADLHWDDGRLATGWPLALDQVPDVDFIAALLDELIATYNIDPAQVYLTGFAAGGRLAYRLACEMPERFAKVAVVSEPMWDYLVDACPPEGEPVSLLMLLGSEDVDYPVEGRTVTTSSDESLELRAFSVEESAAFWAARNGCDVDAVQSPGELDAYVYEDCAADSSVAFYVLEGVGHNWPRVGDYVLNQFGIDATEIITAYFLGDDDVPEMVQAYTANDEIWGGTPRTYTFYVPPSYDPAEPMPLVIALHGRTDDGAGMAYRFNINHLAQEQGFIMVYPDGLEEEWNYIRGAPEYQFFETNDVEFFLRLVDDLAVDLNIDRQRLYVTGFSNGGFMTQRVACEAADQFAAFAVVSGALFPYFIDLCEGMPPVPILFIHGTHDFNVPWDGSTFRGTVISMSIPDTVAFWAVHNNCVAGETQSRLLPSMDAAPSTLVTFFEFGGCDADTIFYRIDGGGHNLPGVEGRLSPSIAGAVNMDINAAEVIWDFFSQQALSSEE